MASALHGPGGQSGHERARDLAAIAIDFELDDAERAELEGHLQDCADCRAHVTSLAADADSLAALPTIDAPPRVRRGVLAGRPTSLWSRLGPAAVALSILVLVVGPLGAGALYFQGLLSGGAACCDTPIVTPGPASTAAPTQPPETSPSPGIPGPPSRSPSPSPSSSLAPLPAPSPAPAGP